MPLGAPEPRLSPHQCLLTYAPQPLASGDRIKGLNMKFPALTAPSLRRFHGSRFLTGLGAGAIFAGAMTFTTAQAGEADVVNATASCDTQRVCSFSVTVEHGDTGWDHYANHWRVLSPDGQELGKRVLHHPHENEQPFTRSLGGVKIPSDIDSVILEAHDSVHNTGGKGFELTLPAPE